MMDFELFVPFLSHDQLRAEAGRFLRTYHASGPIPVPIEEIIELQFRIDIIPTPGLQEHFDIDAFITSDMESIYVDDYIYRSRRSRYRFSLAHELLLRASNSLQTRQCIQLRSFVEIQWVAWAACKLFDDRVNSPRLPASEDLPGAFLSQHRGLETCSTAHSR